VKILAIYILLYNGGVEQQPHTIYNLIMML